MTQRDGMGREVGGGFRIGNTWTPMADACWCMAKPIQYCKVKKKKNFNWSVCVCPRTCMCTQLCPTLCDPMDCSPPGSSVHGFSKQKCWNGLLFPTLGDFLDLGKSQTQDLTHISYFGRQSLPLVPPGRRAWQPTPVFLPGESHGQRGLAGYSPWGPKESDSTDST